MSGFTRGVVAFFVDVVVILEFLSAHPVSSLWQPASHQASEHVSKQGSQPAYLLKNPSRKAYSFEWQ